MRRLLPFLSLVFVLLPSSANAQNLDFDFGIQCVTVPFRGCASLQLAAVFHEALGQTELRMRFSNWNGLPGFEDPPAGLKSVRVYGLDFENPFTRAFSPRVYSVEGAAHAGD